MNTLLTSVHVPNATITVSYTHLDVYKRQDTGDKQKLSVTTFYNRTKGGVDTTDKLCASYNVARNVCRWPMVIFFAMINMSCLLYTSRCV